MAEKEGFEPSIPFWGIHDFQSCALGQLRDFSIAFADLDIILHSSAFVNWNFSFFAFLGKTSFSRETAGGKFIVDFYGYIQYNNQVC